MFSLHNHTALGSNIRLRDSINVVSELIQYAYDLGLEGIAITDHESVRATVEAQNYLQKKREENPDSRWQTFKLIMGNEIYLCRDNLRKSNYKSGIDKFYHFILLALDEEGHRAIRKLSTKAFSHSFKTGKMRRVPTWEKDLFEIMPDYQGHVIASTACLGGKLATTLLNASSYETSNPAKFQRTLNDICDWLQDLESLFGKGYFFLEMQPSFNAEQIYVNKWIVKLSRRLKIPFIVTTDSHYLRKEDRPIHKAYLNADDGKDREVDAFYATTYLMDEKEIHSYMDESLGYEIVEEAFQNTKLIGEKATNWELKKNFKLPYLPSKEDIELAKQTFFDYPKDKKLNKEIWEKFQYSKEDSDRVFLQRILKKNNSNYDFFWTEDRIQRIEIELKTVWDASVKQNLVWSKYFLQVADYIKLIWEKGDSIVAPGRGSGVGFYLNYLLDIIQIDPMREKVPLFYWRFLNPERASILDIDTDVQSNRRNKIIEALQERYGVDRVIRVSTVRQEKTKASILTAARGLGINSDEAQSIASLIESDRGIQRSLHDTYYGNDEKGFSPNRTFQEKMKEFPELWSVAQRIENLPCGTSIHAGGVIIVDEDFCETSSIERVNSGEWVSAFNLHESEEAAGQVKIDLLATENLTRIRTCLDLLVKYGYVENKGNLKETYENVIGVYKLDRNNPEMWEKLANNKIINVFQFDTPQGVHGIELSKPTSVEELAALNSIMRLMASEKGAEQPLEKYARFKKDLNLWEEEMVQAGLNEDERKLLHNFLDYEYGICSSQED